MILQRLISVAVGLLALNGMTLNAEQVLAGDPHDLIHEAWILHSDNEYIAASRYFSELQRDAYPLAVRLTAYNGLIRIYQKPELLLRNALQSEREPWMRRGLIRLVSELPQDFAEGIQFLNTPELSVAEKVQLITLLAGRNDPSIHGVALGYLDSDEAALREAALAALFHIGEPSDIRILLKWIHEGTEEEARLAAAALHRIPSEAADMLILKYLQNSATGDRVALLQAVAARNIQEGVPMLLEHTASRDETVRLEAVEAFAAIAEGRYLEDALAGFKRAATAAEVRAWGEAVYFIAERYTQIPAAQRLIRQTADTLQESNKVSLLQRVSDRLRT